MFEKKEEEKITERITHFNLHIREPLGGLHLNRKLICGNGILIPLKKIKVFQFSG